MGNPEPKEREILALQEREILEPEARALWNTGAAIIHNRTNRTLYVVDGENQYYRRFIDPMSEKSFNGVILPWCNNSNEVRDKAFRFYHYLGGFSYIGLFYMFQNYQDDQVYWTAWGREPLFENRVYAGSPPSSYIDIVVEENNGNITVKAIKLW